MATRKDEGVNLDALVAAIEAWLAKGNTLARLETETGVQERVVRRMREGGMQHASLDQADRICLAIDIDLDDVLVERRRGGGRPADGSALRCISPEDLQLAHDLHWRGVPLRRIARYWLASERITYRSLQAACDALYSAFERRGWPRRERDEMTRVANMTHGNMTIVARTPGAPEHEAHLAWRREYERRRSGTTQCIATSSRGKRCQRTSARGQWCRSHDPALAAERAEYMRVQRARLEAQKVRWGDVRADVEAAVARCSSALEFGRLAGFEHPTTLTQVLRYQDDARLRPRTWARIQRGMALLDQGGLADVG